MQGNSVMKHVHFLREETTTLILIFENTSSSSALGPCWKA